MPDLGETIQSAVMDAIDKYVEDVVNKAIAAERLFTVAEIAALSGFSEPAIRNWINREHDPLPAFRVEKEYRVRMKDFDTWLENYRTNRVRI